MKNLWAVLAGIAVAIILVIIGDIITHKIYPVPKGLDFADPIQVATYMKTLPSSALFLVLIGQVVGLFGGGIVVSKISKDVKPLHIFSLIFILLSVMNLVMITHPVWFAIASLSTLILVYLTLIKLTSKN